MAVTVFTWEMFKYRPHDGVGVGHASLALNGSSGAIYISFWPAKMRDPEAAWKSRAKVHFMNGDKAADGQPAWASKPIMNLNEEAIIGWWAHIQADPLLNYKHKTPFQSLGISNAEQGNTYNILKNQCSTTVVDALWQGADAKLRSKITSWKHAHTVLTVTPRQVRDLIEDLF